MGPAPSPSAAVMAVSSPIVEKPDIGADLMPAPSPAAQRHNSLPSLSLGVTNSESNATGDQADGSKTSEMKTLASMNGSGGI